MCVCRTYLTEKLQLKLEACSPSERDRWVSALGEAVRRARAPPLAAEVEEERWNRKEEAAAEAQRRLNAQRRRENEASRAGIAAKYGLDPARYASRRGGGEGEVGRGSWGGGRDVDGVWGARGGGGGGWDGRDGTRGAAVGGWGGRPGAAGGGFRRSSIGV